MTVPSDQDVIAQVERYVEHSRGWPYPHERMARLEQHIATLIALLRTRSPAGAPASDSESTGAISSVVPPWFVGAIEAERSQLLGILRGFEPGSVEEDRYLEALQTCQNLLHRARRGPAVGP